MTADPETRAALREVIDAEWLARNITDNTRARLVAALGAGSTDEVRRLREALDWLIDHSVPTHAQWCFIRGDDEPCICGVSDKYEEVLALRAALTDKPSPEEPHG